MVVDDLNADGGLLGRHLELHFEESATDDGVAAAKARKLVEVDRVDVVFGGIYNSTRQANAAHERRLRLEPGPRRHGQIVTVVS